MDAKDRRTAELEQRVAELEALLKAVLDEIARLKKELAQFLETSLFGH